MTILFSRRTTAGLWNSAITSVSLTIKVPMKKREMCSGTTTEAAANMYSRARNAPLLARHINIPIIIPPPPRNNRLRLRLQLRVRIPSITRAQNPAPLNSPIRRTPSPIGSDLVFLPIGHPPLKLISTRFIPALNPRPGSSGFTFDVLVGGRLGDHVLEEFQVVLVGDGVGNIFVLDVSAGFPLEFCFLLGLLGEVLDEHFGREGDDEGCVVGADLDVGVLGDNFFDAGEGELGLAGDFLAGGDGGGVVGHLDEMGREGWRDGGFGVVRVVTSLELCL
ncbi:hypothetical protein QC763_0094090 [Podospora pseudopauciseta]|uniref:Uncharacterized protein n=1 Tax=Podospora pseudopauciseta TaxID=2093780 RepID=A0ABR0H4M3_9PEZI|nr:hypothetical protein QC763_0094090 [Podospora pseudopauciseta]